jgi:phage gp36-like protein
MPYCERRDLIERLSETGLLTVLDDADEAAQSFEASTNLDCAIAAASAEIDAAIAPWTALPFNGSSEWLRQRAIDLAAEHLAERKGAHVPASFVAAAARSRIWLDQVRLGEFRAPGLVYPADAFSPDERRTGLPRVVNPGSPRDDGRFR